MDGTIADDSGLYRSCQKLWTKLKNVLQYTVPMKFWLACLVADEQMLLVVGKKHAFSVTACYVTVNCTTFVTSSPLDIIVGGSKYSVLI